VSEKIIQPDSWGISRSAFQITPFDNQDRNFPESASSCLEGAFMTRKIACILAILETLTVSAQAQQSVPKPTKADAVKVVKIISANKTIATYCKHPDLGDEIKNTSSAGDNSKLAQLSKQADELGKALGPEFVRLNAGLLRVNLQSREGQELSAELDKRQVLPVDVRRPQPVGIEGRPLSSLPFLYLS
jgi:hypothetical protein